MSICEDPHRDRSVICVVESVADLRAIERAGVLRGTFHVLAWCIGSLDGIGPEDLYIDSLVERVKAEGTREVVLAMNANVDGDTTALYLSEFLHLMCSRLVVWRLGSRWAASLSISMVERWLEPLLIDAVLAIEQWVMLGLRCVDPRLLGIAFREPAI